MSCFMSNTTVMVAFSKLPDPRQPRNQLYSLQDIVSTAILGTICACDDYCEISEWTEAHLDWLQSLGVCLEGAPSHDTYERFFRQLDAGCFQHCFLHWTELLKDRLGKHIAIDGKTLCNSGSENENPIHLVSAFATENSLVIGQLKTKGKGKELEGIQRILEILDLKGAVVTIDAGGCHKIVAQQIVNAGGDYLLCVKGNQGNLCAELENFFTQAIDVEPNESGCSYWKTEERGKNRIEKREVWACGAIGWLPQKEEWVGLRSIVGVRRMATENDKVTTEMRYFISSMPAEAKHQGEIIRGHWGIENSLHWQLDVTYREDLSRVREGNGAENLSVLRRATLNILRNDKNNKRSLKRRRLKASWDKNYLMQLVGVN